MTNDSQSIAQQLLAPSQTAAFTPVEMLGNMSLALFFGLLLASIYRYTHKGLSYSQSFTLSIVFVTTIVAITLMAIESSLARAFALVGALSIIRFRTVVKDSKDTAYIFAGLAIGTAAGTSNYLLAVIAGGFISALAIILHQINFGASAKGEFILRFTLRENSDSSKYLDILNKHTRRSTLLHVEPSGDGQFITMSHEVLLKRDTDTRKFASEFTKAEGVLDASLIAAVSDVDY